jgi:hypothetical protein
MQKGTGQLKSRRYPRVTRKFFPEDREKTFIKSVLSTRHIFASKMN